jgi:hypothetical protein
MVYFLLFIIIVFIAFYRNYDGQGVNKFITEQVGSAYEKVAPYSFKVVREKTKQLGREYTPRQYMIQTLILGGFAGVVSYLYFYNIMWTVVYVVIAIAFIPYLSYLRCKREYSEFLFEQIQVYTSNTIMEFATTQSFVKAIEGVRDSGILDDPVRTDVNHMIDLAYTNGDIEESLTYMNNLYPYYIVKNMHQLFLQITKEGAKDAMDSLENLQLDIDMLVESVYRDRIERATFHKKFLQFGVMLYLLVLLIQVLLGTETYLELLNKWYVALVMHCLIIINSYFLLKGEKYYNENVGAE